MTVYPLWEFVGMDDKLLRGRLVTARNVHGSSTSASCVAVPQAVPLPTSVDLRLSRDGSIHGSATRSVQSSRVARRSSTTSRRTTRERSAPPDADVRTRPPPSATGPIATSSTVRGSREGSAGRPGSIFSRTSAISRGRSRRSPSTASRHEAAAHPPPPLAAVPSPAPATAPDEELEPTRYKGVHGDDTSASCSSRPRVFKAATSVSAEGIEDDDVDVEESEIQLESPDRPPDEVSQSALASLSPSESLGENIDLSEKGPSENQQQTQQEGVGEEGKKEEHLSLDSGIGQDELFTPKSQSAKSSVHASEDQYAAVEGDVDRPPLTEALRESSEIPRTPPPSMCNETISSVEQEVPMETGYKSKGLFGDDTSLSCSAKPVREHDLRAGVVVEVGKDVTSIPETQDARDAKTPRRPEDDESEDVSPTSQLPPKHSVSPRSSIRSSKRDFDAGICLSQEDEDDMNENQEPDVSESSPVSHATDDKRKDDASELEPTLKQDVRVVAGQFEEQSDCKGEVKAAESPQVSDSTITSAQPILPTNDKPPVPEQLADDVEVTQDLAQRSQPRSKGLLGEDTSLSCTATDVASIGVLRSLRECEAPPLVQRMSKGLLAAEDPNASCTSLPPSGFQPTAASATRVLKSKGLYGEDASASCVASSIHARTAGVVSSAENNAYAVESTATLTVSQVDVEQTFLKRYDLPLPTGSLTTDTTKDLNSEQVDPSYLHTPPSTELALKISMARDMLDQSTGASVHPSTVVDEPQGDAAMTDSGISLTDVTADLNFSGEVGSATASGDPEATPERQASAEKTPTGSQEADWEKGDSGQELSRSVGSVKPAEPVAQDEQISDEGPPETTKAASVNGVSFHGDDALPSRKADGEDSEFLTGDEGDEQEVETDEQEADTDKQPILQEKAGESDYATADEEEDDEVAMPAGGGDKQELKPYDSECLKTAPATPNKAAKSSASKGAAEITVEGSQIPDIHSKESHTKGVIHLSADADEVHHRTVDDVPDENVPNTDSEQCPPKDLYVKNECLPLSDQNSLPLSYRERVESHRATTQPELLHSEGEETICLERSRVESRDSIAPRRRNVDTSGSICLNESDHGSGSISLGQSLHAPSIQQGDEQRTSVAGGSRYSTGHLLPPKERSSSSIKELSTTRLASLRSRESASQKHSVTSARNVNGRSSTKSTVQTPPLTPRGSHISPSPSLGESRKSPDKPVTREAPGGFPERRSVGSRTSSHHSKDSRNSSAHVLKMNNAETKSNVSATASSSGTSRRSLRIVQRDALLSSEPETTEDKITDSLPAGSAGVSLKQSYRSECLPISRKEENDLHVGEARETSVHSVGVTTQLRAMAEGNDATADSEQPMSVRSEGCASETKSHQLKQREERNLDVGLDDELLEDAVAVLPEEVSQVSDEVEITHEESGVSRHTAFSRGYPETPAPEDDEQQAIQMMKLRSECLRDGDLGPTCGDVEPSMSSRDANLLASGVLESHPGDVGMALNLPPFPRGRSSSESGLGVQVANSEALRNFREQEGAAALEATPAINIIGELRSECLASHRGSAASVRKTPVHFLLASDGSSEDEMIRRSVFRRATPLPPLGVVDLKELRHKSSTAGSRSILEMSEASTDTDYPIGKPADVAFCTCDSVQAQRPLGTLGTITQRQSLPDASAPRPYRMKRCSNCGEDCIYPAPQLPLTEDTVLDKDKRRRSFLARAIETCERELGPLNDTLQRLQEKVRAMQLPELSGVPRRSTSHHLPHSPASPKRLHSRSASSVLMGTAPRPDAHPIAPSVPCPYCGLQLVPESALSPLARMYILLSQPRGLQRGSQRSSKPSTPPPGAEAEVEDEDHP